MDYLRLSIKAPVLVFFSLLCYVVLLTGVLILTGQPRRRANWQSRVLAIWARLMMWTIGMHREVVGRPPGQTGLFVANHLSYVDIVLIAASMRTAFVAKKDVESWPVIGHVVKMAGTIFVDRQRHRTLLNANDHIALTLSAATSVVVFAEGSSTDGQSVLPFRASLLQIASSQGYPVHYGYLTYRLGDTQADLAATRERICWWGDAGFFRHIGRLLMLPGFSARLVFGDSAVSGSDRKQLAQMLYERVLGQFKKYRWS